MRRFIAALLALCITMPLASIAFAGDVAISGALEVDITSVDDGSATNQDITTATVELDFDAAVADQVDAHAILLFEEDATEPIAVDEAFITLKPNDQFSLQAGSYVVPFGSFDALVLSDPITLELAETAQSALTFAFNSGPITAQLATFNGDVNEAADTEETINVLCIALDYSTGDDADIPINAGVSYITSIADSDTLQGLLATASAVDSQIAGYAAHASATYSMVTVIAEYVSAAGDFKAADFGTSEDIAPMAYNLEVGLAVNDKTSIAARYGGSADMGDVLFESEMALAVSHSLYDNTTIAAEYLSGAYDDDTGADDVSAITLELAVSF